MTNLASQVQLKLSLSQQLNQLLQARANHFGLPITQYVKHIIVKNLEESIVPTYEASDWVEEQYQSSMKDIHKVKRITDFKKYFDSL